MEGLHYRKLCHLVWGGKEGRVQVGRLQRTEISSPMSPKDTEPNMMYGGQRGYNS